MNFTNTPLDQLQALLLAEQNQLDIMKNNIAVKKQTISTIKKAITSKKTSLKPKKPKKPTIVIQPSLMNTRMSLTMGDAGENHAGMEMCGSLQKPGTGHTTDDLKLIQTHMESLGKTCQYKDLSAFGKSAAVLIIRNYIDTSLQSKVFEELNSFEWDYKFKCPRRGIVLNKHARGNVVLLEGHEQEPDYENGKGRIVDSNKLTHLRNIKASIITDIQQPLTNPNSTTKPIPYIMEGNRYYDFKKCGIGLHGDAERTRVICLSIGGHQYPMRWVWFHNSKPVSQPYDVMLNSGDVYLMSEEAVGHKWKLRSQHTLRHAAGIDKYISLDRFTK